MQLSALKLRLQVLGAGAPLPITLRDGTAATVAVAELSIRDLYTWIEHLGGRNTPALVALACGQPIAWADTLSDESFAVLAAEAFRQNFPRAVTLSQRDPIAAANLMPILHSLAQAESLSAGPTSPATSPAPAPSGSAAGTGSAAST